MKKKGTSVLKYDHDTSNISLYFTEMKESKDVKTVKTQVPFAPEYFINDLSINHRGTDEDKAYAFNASLRANIRRGNSVVYKVDKDDAPAEYFFGRRGLQKFFDLQREYLELNLGEISELTRFGIKNGGEHKELERVIFNEAENALKNGDTVSILKLVKANGENAQVSYFEPLDAWMVSSKNVGLLARNKADIALYVGSDRFSFARLIADVWFNQIDKFDEVTIKELKNDLNNKTMVGEYCGNQEFQHLVKYTEIDILFYAIVDHQSKDSCISPILAYQIFNKYKLGQVAMTNEGTFSTFKELNTALKTVFDNVAASDIEGEQEGSVLYFLRTKKEGEKIIEQVLSLSKLKTLEYRIFRKLREKLKNYLVRKDNNLRVKFEQETKELCLNNDPAKPLEYYFKIGELAFSFASKYPAESSIIAEQYISFLSVLVYCLDTNSTPTPPMFQKEEIEKLLKVNWSSYSSASVKFDPSTKMTIEKETHSLSDPISSSTKRSLFVIIPISIPGMGKSTFVGIFKQIVESSGDSLFIVSSDDIRKSLMDKLHKQKPLLNSKQLFDQTQKNSSKQFYSELEESIKKLPLTTSSKNVFVFIDKNHPPNAIDKTVQLASNFCSADFNLKICTILTSEAAPNKYRIDGSGSFPFSLNLFLNCIDRVQNRADHPTLIGGGAKSLDTMIMFCNLFRNASLSDDSLHSSQIDIVLRFPFIKEDEGRKFPEDIVQKFEDAISQTIPGQACKNQGLIQSLSDKLKNAKLTFENIPLKELQEYAHLIYLQCIDDTAEKSSSIVPAKKTKEDKMEIEEQKEEVKEEKIEEEEEIIEPVFSKSQHQKPFEGPRVVRKAAVPFNPPKKPIYLGLFANDEDLVKKEQTIYVSEMLNKILSEFKLPIIRNNFENLKTVFKFLPSHHITTYFVKKQEGIYYDNFEEGLSHPIEVLAMAYVPNKIICGVCLPNPDFLQIENKVPHMTLFVSEWAPRFSNNVLQALFTDEGAPLSAELKNLTNPDKSMIAQFSLNIQEINGKETVYFIKPAKKILSFEATTRAFYGNNGPAYSKNKKR